MNELKYDYVIVGGGPAGLQLGYFLKKNNRNYIILEASYRAGEFFSKYPTHRKLISANKVYTGYEDKVRNMRWDWNSLINDDDDLLFKKYSKEFFPPADDMVRYLNDFSVKQELNIRYNTRIQNIKKDKEFILTDDSGNIFSGKRLIMATGVSKQYIPDIPGVENAELYSDASIDPEDFVNQRVLIVGKGNSAFETADNLIGTASRIYVTSPTPITLSWKSKFVGHLRAVNNNFIDTYQLKLQNVMLDAQLSKIEKSDKGLITTFHYTHADDEVEPMVFDRVIMCTGFRFDASIFDESCKPEMKINDRFPAQTSSFESVNVNDLFFIGTLMQERDFKKKQSGFIHGFRHNIESLSYHLEEKYHRVPWPSKILEDDPDILAQAVLDRANTAPGMWQQTGFISDVIVKLQNGECRYYYDVPTQYIPDSEISNNAEYHVLTLEFGLDIINASPDPLAVERIHKDDVEGAHLSTGIHPIIRKYSFNTFIKDHHIVEDIIPEWDEQEIHHEPLAEYFGKKRTKRPSLSEMKKVGENQRAIG